MMKPFKRNVALACLLASTMLAGCTTSTLPVEDPYAAYRDHMPRSILVLPPANESVDVLAPWSWVTTVSEPIAEQGYYVFPVAIVDAFMKENGLPLPEDMHAAPLDKLGEVFGADAVLYVTLTEFGQKFELLSSTTRVDAVGQLVDVDTGLVLWQGELNHADSGNNGSSNGLLGSLVNAAVNQIGGTLTDRPHDAAIIANRQWFRDSRKGLLKGPRHPGFEAQMAEAREAEQAAAEAAATAGDGENTSNSGDQSENDSPPS